MKAQSYKAGKVYLSTTAMKRVELTIPLALLGDLGILNERFFRHNESVEVLQTFSVRPEVAALFVRVRRRGPFKNPEAVRREARKITKRCRLERFEVLSADPKGGEYVAWIEWRVPGALRGDLEVIPAGVVPVEISRAGPREARAVFLASEAALPTVRELLVRLGAPFRVRTVRSAPAATWQPLAGLTARQRDMLALAHRLGYYDTPAKVSLDRVAGLVGISKAALSKHLRVAERKVLGEALGRTARHSQPRPARAGEGFSDTILRVASQRANRSEVIGLDPGLRGKLGLARSVRENRRRLESKLGAR